MRVSKNNSFQALTISVLITGSGWVAAVQLPPGVQLAAKQELVKGNGSEIQSIDPHKTEGVPEHNISNDLFEGLTIPDPNGKVIPGVAERWENKDFKIWTFHLRSNAKWSNGAPVTAHDFVYSWRRLVDPKTASPYASYLQYGHLLNVDDIIAGKLPKEQLGIEALDDLTLQVTLSEPVPYFDKLLIHNTVSPVYRPVIEKFAESWTLPRNFVGNGAFKLQEHKVNEKIVVVRNPYYWDNANTQLNKVTFLPISSEVTDVNRYLSENGSDMTYNNLPIELFKKLRQTRPDELKVSPYLCTYYYELNNTKPPLTDVRVRTALKLGLDRDILVNQVLAQGQSPAYSFTNPATAGITINRPEWFGWSQQQRNTEAKRLLQAAGFGPNNPLKLSLLYNTSDLHKKLAISATSLWKENLGITVKLMNQEWKTYLDSRHQGDYEIARAGWCEDYNEPSSALNYMLSNSSNNTSFYKSTDYDNAMVDALMSPDDESRSRNYGRAEQILDQDSPYIPVYYYANTRLVKPYVGGYTGQDPLDNILDKDLYIIKH